MKNRHPVLAVLVGLTVALSAVGCAEDAIVSTSPSLSLSPSATPVVRTDPVSAFGLQCADLASDELISLVVGAHGAPLASPGIRADAPGAGRAAILQDGGMMCEWPSLDGAGGNVSRLSVVALPEATSLFARALPGLQMSPFPWSPRYTLFDNFSGTLVKCDDAYEALGNVCSWQVLDGDVWLALQLTNLPSSEVSVPSPREDPEKGRLPLVPIVEGSTSLPLVSKIVDTFRGSLRVKIDRPDAITPSCAELIDAAALRASTSTVTDPVIETAVSEPESYTSQLAAPWGFSMWAYSVERLGHRHCIVSKDGESVGRDFDVTVTRGMAWLLEAPFGFPDGGTVGEVDGVGTAYSLCSVGEDGKTCILTAVRDDVTVAVRFAGSDDPMIPTEIARLVLNALH
jgi:hypothetical protein